MTPKIRWQAAIVGLAIVIGASAAADQWNQKTLFTFSDSIELPGKTLPAGTYTFRLLDSPATRHIVQVFNEDESQLLATLLAVPAERKAPADEPMVSFAERGAEAPAAVQFWFYPGRTIGHEFVYPREQAMRIARASNTPVLAIDATGDAEAMRQGRVVTIDPEGREGEYAERTMTEEERAADRAHDTTAMAQQAEETEPTESAQSAQPMQPAETAPMAPSQPAQTAQSGQSVQGGSPAATRPSGSATTRADDMRQSGTAGQVAADEPRATRLPQTASGEPMLLLLAVSSILGLGAVKRMRRGF